MNEITEKQRHILRHALGTRFGSAKEYRNHFVTGPGSDDYDDCVAMVKAGLMVQHSGSELSGGDPIFIVTDAGKKEAWKIEVKP